MSDARFVFLIGVSMGLVRIGVSFFEEWWHRHDLRWLARAERARRVRQEALRSTCRHIIVPAPIKATRTFIGDFVPAQFEYFRMYRRTAMAASVQWAAFSSLPLFTEYTIWEFLRDVFIDGSVAWSVRPVGQGPPFRTSKMALVSCHKTSKPRHLQVEGVVSWQKRTAEDDV